MEEPEGNPPDDEPDLARSVLAGVRSGPRRGGRRAGLDREIRRRTRQDNLAGRGTRGWSAAGPDPVNDPEPVGALLGGLVAEEGWERPLSEARVFAEWNRLVGEQVAAHCHPQSLRDGELRIAAESTAWATQLRLLAATLLARLVAELGPEVVTRLTISGPVVPTWNHGAYSVRGARGPRDTYG